MKIKIGDFSPIFIFLIGELYNARKQMGNNLHQFFW